MTSLLNHKYFTKIHSIAKDNISYDCYKPKHNSLILFSEDGTPLASFQLLSQNINEKPGRAVITERPLEDVPADLKNTQLFQGMINIDNQEIEFVITNLTDLGYINYNIMKSSGKITEINPGGLNEINELRPNESYAVQSDQNANNASIILSTVKDSVGATISVKTDEVSKAPTERKGTYYYLSVVPELVKKDLCKLYEKTVWRTVDFFVKIRKVAPQNQAEFRAIRPNQYGGLRQMANFLDERDMIPESHHDIINNSNDFDDLEEEGDDEGFSFKGLAKKTKKFFGGLGKPKTQNARLAVVRDQRSFLESAENLDSLESKSASLESRSDRFKPRSIGFGFNREKSKPQNYPMSLPGSIGSNENVGLSFSASSSTSSYDTMAYNQELYTSTSPMPYMSNDKVKSEEEDTGMGFSLFDGDDTVVRDLSKKIVLKNDNSAISDDDEEEEGEDEKENADNETDSESEDDLVMESKIAQIKHGRKVEVNSVQSGVEYDYDHVSNPCTITLSVQTKLEFAEDQKHADMIEACTDLINKHINLEYSEFLSKGKIYEDSTCCLCLENDPDTIFYQCGHKSSHYACSSKLDKNQCPLCRSYITARLKVSEVKKAVPIATA